MERNERIGHEYVGERLETLELLRKERMFTIDDTDPCCVLVEEAWDCECDGSEHVYIHSKREKKCDRCGTRPDEQPDARYFELIEVFPELCDVPIYRMTYVALDREKLLEREERAKLLAHGGAV